MFSEARAGSRQVDFEEGHRLYTYIGDHFAAGVGILVHQRHVPNIIRHQPVSDRLLEVDIRIGERVFAFIAVYMPHAGYHIDILNSTYDLLMKTSTAATRRGHSLVIGGDFNAQPGVGIRGWNLCPGVTNYIFDISGFFVFKDRNLL